MIYKQDRSSRVGVGKRIMTSQQPLQARELK